WHATTVHLPPITSPACALCSRSGCWRIASMGSTVVDERRRATRPRLLILTPDFPPAAGGIQVVAHRLAANMSAFETLVLAPDAPGAREHDAECGVRVKRVGVRGGSRGVRAASLNAGALLVASRFRPAL